MNYFLKNTKRLVILSGLLLVILTTLGYLSLSLKAQLPFDPKERAEKSADESLRKKKANLFGTVKLDDMFSKDKSGCGMKLSMFLVMSNYYKSGAKAQEVANNKILGDLIQGVFDDMSKTSSEKAGINAMKEFKTCLAKAKPHRSASIEYDLNLKYKPCGKLNTAMLDILGYIKNRRDIDSIIDRYERENIDFTGSSYEGATSPVALFAGQVAGVANSSGYKNAVDVGLGIVVMCYS